MANIPAYYNKYMTGHVHVLTAFLSAVHQLITGVAQPEGVGYTEIINSDMNRQDTT